MQEIESQLVELGYQIVAVSPDKLEKTEALKGKKDFQYTLVSDSSAEGARSFGIAFKVADETYNTYKNRFKLDLEERSGQEHHQLPVPSVFLIGQKGDILFEYINPNYRVRIHPDLLLAAARVHSKQ